MEKIIKKSISTTSVAIKLIKMLINKLSQYEIEIKPPINFPIGVPSMKYGLAILHYLNDEIRKLFDDIDDIFELIRTDYRKFVDLKIKFFALSSSYIIHVGIIEGIFKMSYEKMLCELNEIDIGVSVSKDKVGLINRNNEIELYSYYRNKIFAHTSFANPKYHNKKDSISLQYTSLLYYAGNFVQLEGDHLALGGGSFIVDKEEIIPTLDIIENHNSLVLHFNNWENMFLSILEKIDDRVRIKKVITASRHLNA